MRQVDEMQDRLRMAKVPGCPRLMGGRTVKDSEIKGPFHDMFFCLFVFVCAM